MLEEKKPLFKPRAYNVNFKRQITHNYHEKNRAYNVNFKRQITHNYHKKKFVLGNALKRKKLNIVLEKDHTGLHSSNLVKEH